MEVRSPEKASIVLNSIKEGGRPTKVGRPLVIQTIITDSRSKIVTRIELYIEW